LRRGLAILAAGASRRAGEDKLLAELGGHPVIAGSLAAAAAAGVFDRVVVVGPPERGGPLTDIVASRAPEVPVVAGGATRTASSWAALDALADCEIIAIHDAARPFALPSLFARCVEIAEREGSAVAGIPLAETVRRADEAGRAVAEVEREGLWAAQTPQVFRRQLLARAREAAGDRAFGDDAAAVTATGAEVRMVLGDRLNIKLTTLEDLAYARELVAKGLTAIPALQLR